MKVLWITNITFPEALAILANNKELKSSGGWMLGAANELLKIKMVQLYIVSVSDKVKKLTKINGKEIVYFIIPLGKGNTRLNIEYERYFREIQKEVQPDIVHIHGTEFSHGNAYLKACGNNNVVLSIQGLLSVICNYYYAGITRKEIFKCMTFHDLLRGGIISSKKDFQIRGEYEMDTIKMVKHIIGRTSWDKAHSWAINPDSTYYFCNEILRPEFYDGSTWEYIKCNKYTVFLSQANYPLKGLHQVLKAMPLIIRHYPNTKIRVAGTDISHSTGIKGLLHFSEYGKYIKSLIKKYNLEDRVYFTGSLNAEEIKKEYLSSNLFLCPSAIENSPNSLGEAQVLGVPCIASYVGGIPDMMHGNEDNLYRFDDVEMLANKICMIFGLNEKVKVMQKEAIERHNPKRNIENLFSIYNRIITNC